MRERKRERVGKRGRERGERRRKEEKGGERGKKGRRKKGPDEYMVVRRGGWVTMCVCLCVRGGG